MCSAPPSFTLSCIGMTCLDLCGDKSSSAHVTNSVNLADALRIADLAKGQGSPDGELLLCKVFVGLSSQVKTNKVYVVSVTGLLVLAIAILMVVHVQAVFG